MLKPNSKKKSTKLAGKTTGGVAKCRLFSQATTKFKCAKKKMKNKYYHVKVPLKIFLLNGHNSFHGIKI